MRKGGWYNPKNHFFVGIVAYCYMNEIFNILTVFGIFCVCVLGLITISV